MPAYKDTERQTPEQLAEFILKERVCKNCKWKKGEYEYLKEEFGCINGLVIVQVVSDGMEVEASGFDPLDTFGCNQWKKK